MQASLRSACLPTSHAARRGSRDAAKRPAGPVSASKRAAFCGGISLRPLRAPGAGPRGARPAIEGAAGGAGGAGPSCRGCPGRAAPGRSRPPGGRPAARLRDEKPFAHRLRLESAPAQRRVLEAPFRIGAQRARLEKAEARHVGQRHAVVASHAAACVCRRRAG